MDGKQDAIVVSIENSDEEEEDIGDYEFKAGRSVCIVNTTNRDLGPIVNGYPGDPVDMRPFDK